MIGIGWHSNQQQVNAVKRNSTNISDDDNYDNLMARMRYDKRNLLKWSIIISSSSSPSSCIRFSITSKFWSDTRCLNNLMSGCILSKFLFFYLTWYLIRKSNAYEHQYSNTRWKCNVWMFFFFTFKYAASHNYNPIPEWIAPWHPHSYFKPQQQQ